MTSESNRISVLSTNFVQSVAAVWGWTCQAMAQENDDGFDGYLYIRTNQINKNKPQDRRSWRHSFTGGMIHIQVKTGDSLVTESQDHFVTKISDLEVKKELWQLSPVPSILIYVKQAQQGVPTEAWWVNLKSEETYFTGTQIKIPKINRFQPSLECRSPLARLARRQIFSAQLPVIKLPAGTYHKMGALNKSPKFNAWGFYKKWRDSLPTNPSLGPVIINRTGWSHITRRGRPIARILTSFDLLPIAAKIISEIKDWRVLARRGEQKNSDGTLFIIEYLGVSAWVEGPSRISSEVMVILKRRTTYTEETIKTPSPEQPEQLTAKINVTHKKLWFYTVYQPGRSKK